MENMIHPQRWRETCDPFSLAYRRFQLLEILGYPHAGNDVFHARGRVDGEEVTAYVKVARQRGADIANEVHILTQLDDPVFPRVLDCDESRFSVTAALPGLRLSVIAGDNRDQTALTYMEEYGAALGRLHRLQISAKPQADRKFHHTPAKEQLEALGLSHLAAFFARKPARGTTVFCHGDFHYANVLWQDHHISAILDFELAGYGDRDFDIAWALFLRPGQQFLQTDAERERFLQGYRTYGECNAEAVNYYMAQCYVHFLGFCEEAPYRAYVRDWLARHCR